MSVRIAYLILAHKAPSHLVRLVTRLQGPECTFVIHLDGKSVGPDWDEACEKLRQPNILWAERIDCEWGDFSLVQATLNAIGKLYASVRPFDFAVLLSGQDYPVKSNGYIESVRKGGAVTLIGNIAPKVDLPLQSVVTRQIRVQGSCASSGEYPACIDLLARGAIRVDSLISAVAPLEEGPQWFDRLYSKEPNLMKVVLQP